jgi:hypothetical protein
MGFPSDPAEIQTSPAGIRAESGPCAGARVRAAHTHTHYCLEINAVAGPLTQQRVTTGAGGRVDARGRRSMTASRSRA